MSDSKEVEIVILVADLSGYTALTEAHGDRSAAKIVTRYLEIVEGVLHGGVRLVQRVGDEVLISGEKVSGVIRTALKLANTIEREPLFPAVHAGIHAGVVLEQEGHFFGSTLNITARVASHARGGQILCTKPVIELAGNLENIEYRALGKVNFKNISEPMAVFEIISSQGKINSNIIDPVCQMIVKPETAPVRLSFKGKNYYFCSIDCAKTFDSHPDRFIKVLNDN